MVRSEIFMNLKSVRKVRLSNPKPHNYEGLK